MWPFRSSIPELYEIKQEGNDIILFHSKGANKFRKDEVLNCKIESDYFSPTDFSEFEALSTFLGFIIFGGFLNMWFSIFPIIVEGKNLTEIWFSQSQMTPWIELFILFVLAILSTYLSLWALKKIIIYNSTNHFWRKDIILLELNNLNIKVRDRYYGRDYSKFFNSKVFDEEKVRRKTLREKQFGKSWFLSHMLSIRAIVVLSLLGGIIFLLNYDTPFWFYQHKIFHPIFEDKLFKLFPEAFTEYSKNYWGYYGHWSNDGLVITTGPIEAFFDGAISNFLFPFLVIIAVVAVVVFLIGAFFYYVFCYGFIITSLLTLLCFSMEHVAHSFDNRFTRLIIPAWLIFKTTKIRKDIESNATLLGLILIILIFLSFFCILLLSVYYFGGFLPIELFPIEIQRLNLSINIIGNIVLTFLLIRWGYIIYKNEKNLRLDGSMFKNLKFNYRNRGDYVLIAVMTDVSAYKHASDRLKEDIFFSLNILSVNGMTLEFMNETKKNNFHLVQTAVKQNYNAYHFASDSLKENDEIKNLYEELKSKNESQTENQ